MIEPHNGLHSHPARAPVEAAFKNAGLTPDQAHDVMDALDDYVRALAMDQKRTGPAKHQARHK